MAPHTNNHLPQTVFSGCTLHSHYTVGGVQQSVLSTVFEHIRLTIVSDISEPKLFLFLAIIIQMGHDI